MQDGATDAAAAGPGSGAPGDGARGAAPPASEPAGQDLAGAVGAYFSARLDLARLEAAEVARVATRKGGLAAGLAVASGFAWALLLAGGLGLAAAEGLPWHWWAIGIGLLHLLVGLVLGICLALPAPPAFPLTRRELEKDRTWLEKLRTKLKSRA